MSDRYEQFGTLSTEDILKRIAGVSTGGQPGIDEFNFLNNLLSARIADSLVRGLAGNTETTAKSANALRDALQHSTEIVKATLENSSAWLINALKVSTETSSKSAKEIEAQIGSLTTALSQVSTDLQRAGDQSAALGRRLNWLTFVLVAAALISAAATSFYAWETKRQVDLMELQRAERFSQHPPANTTSK
jgi:hypothetical protein